MQLYFIRHGQSRNNAHWDEPGFQPDPDPALTESGSRQAQFLAGSLASLLPPSAIGAGTVSLYTSLMERAVQTAAPCARKLGLPLAALDIHESGGIVGRQGEAEGIGLPGKPRSWFEGHFPELALPPELDESGWWNRPFETEDECQRRAGRVWTLILSRHADRDSTPERQVVLFSHGGFFVHFLCAMLDLPWRQAAHGYKSWFLLNNCSISRVDVRNGEVVVYALNRIAHLPDELIT